VDLYLSTLQNPVCKEIIAYIEQIFMDVFPIASG